MELEYALREQAGVAMVVRATDPVELLLIKRASHPSDPWSGHIALPGGRRDAADVDLLGTAIRETREETGVLLDRTRLLGRLPIVAPRGPRLPTIAVAPFLFEVPADTSAFPEPGEVSWTRWFPIDRLRDPSLRVDYRIRLPEGERRFPGIQLDEDVLWGMTWRVVMDLFEALD